MLRLTTSATPNGTVVPNGGVLVRVQRLVCSELTGELPATLVGVDHDDAAGGTELGGGLEGRETDATHPDDATQTQVRGVRRSARRRPQVALLHMTYHAVDTKWALPPGGPA